MKKQTLKLDGMHCASCSLVIEGELEDIGVKARANYARQMVEIEFNPEIIEFDLVVKTIEKQGYRVVG